MSISFFVYFVYFNSIFSFLVCNKYYFQNFINQYHFSFKHKKAVAKYMMTHIFYNSPASPYQKQTDTNYFFSFGNCISILVPLPGALSTLTFAPCRSAPCFTMESPSPVPPRSLEWLLSTR